MKQQINQLQNAMLAKCRQATTKDQTMRVAELSFDIGDVGRQIEKDIKNQGPTKS